MSLLQLLRGIAAALALALAACGGGRSSSPAPDQAGAGPPRCGVHPWCDVSLPPRQRADLLLTALTLDEKISLLAGDELLGLFGGAGTHTGTSNGIPRLGLPTIYYSDGPMGARSGGPATALPAPLGLAATWDPAMAQRYAAVIAEEAKAKGNDVVFGPTVNILRVPHNGRTFEGFGEDPWLVSRMAVGWITGAQERGVIANVKHFAANNQEGYGPAFPTQIPFGVGPLGSRFFVNAVVDERTLREIYLPAFEAAVKEARVGSVMCALNRVNGPYACESEQLLQQLLRDEWGFEGYVLSDYGGVKNPIAGLRAGLDFDPWPGVIYGPAVVTPLTLAGLIGSELIDTRIHAILRTLFAFGFFDRAAYAVDEARIDRGRHARIAGEVEEAAITLLKNDGLLPLEASRLKSIAIIGADADRFQQRGGSAGISPFVFSTPREKITERAGPGVEVRYDPGDDAARAAAVAAAADVVLVFVSDLSVEGVDRTCLSLNCPLDTLQDPRRQDSLIEAVAAANPNTVVVLETGGPVLTPWRGALRGLLAAWIPGSDAGSAITRVLFGDVDPGGRLPATFPEREADLPTAGHPERYPGGVDADYSEGVFVGYRWFDQQDIVPAFPFGFGLSYTTFAMRHLAIEDRGTGLRATLTVLNTGSRAGWTVPQLYLGLPSPGPEVPQPPRALKAFTKFLLQPGESRRVTLELDARALSYWDVARHDWQVAPGCYRVYAGSSSRELPLQSAFARGGASCAGAAP
ncbi:MAG TPA: glycoside hydrolase family 3 C-terminal domain-containing protein [Solimonas sp.]|nr:glycoside hydrolase family 3 C-terminal domain-containing protein [Solimonas sp.]